MTLSNQQLFSVLHVATALSWRGGEQQVAYLVDELHKKSIKQFVMCTSGSAMEKFCSGNGIPFFSSLKNSSFDIFYAKKLAKICKDNKISLIHTHDSHAHTFAIMAAIFFGCKSKIIVSRRVDFEVSVNPFSKIKYNHASVKRILCVSDAIRIITSKAVKDKKKLVTVHSGIDFSRFAGKKNSGLLHKQYFLDSSVKIIAKVAAIAPHKDYITFVDTVALLKTKLTNTVFFIIGDGPNREEIENYIHTKNLEDIIFMTGFRNDIPDILPEIDILLITSETEGLGTSILDAFACDVPVVATAAGGIPEIVIHEQTGLLANVKDSQGLAAAVARMMNDIPLRLSLINGARQHLNSFTTESTAAKTIHEYHAVAGVAL